jgi:uncharacterized protein YgiM (DUF1202 family)
MAKYCIQCGATLTAGARFCGECGAPVPVGDDAISAEPLPEQSVAEAPPEPAEPVANWDAAAADEVSISAAAEPAYFQPAEDLGEIAERNGPNWLLIAGGAAILALLIGYYFLFLRDDMSSGLEDRVSAAPKQVEEVVAKEYFAVADANIRDKASAQGTNILGKVARGNSVSGNTILGEDGTTDWLELADGKGFVAMVNLSETAPPALVKMLGDKNWTTNGPIEIWSQPDTASTLVDRVGPGTTLSLFGITANDFIEIKLKKGGVGYIADGARIAALADGKPIAIAFNPSSCSFGPEIDRMFAAMGDRLRANYKELENRDYPSDEARERALASIEGKSTFEKLQRNYEGLTVTAIAQHYESQSVYFAEPPARVIEVFRSKGYRIGRDGQFPSTDLYAGIGTTQAQGARYGKADLTCGV